MEEKLGMKIVRVSMQDEYLYHLDTMIFVANTKQAIIAVDMFEKKEIKALESVVEIFPVSDDDAYNGLTNSVRLGNMVLCASDLHTLKSNDERYDEEKHKVETLNKICSKLGMEPMLFNLSEFTKSGAMLSCMVMHLNRVDHQPLV